MAANSSANTEVSLTPTSEIEAIAYRDAKDIMVMLSLQAPQYEPNTRASVDIMAVVDRSGSMSGTKLALVKQTLHFMLRELRSTDRLGIVSFDTLVQSELPLTKQDQEGREHSKNAIDKISVGGATNLCGGLAQGIVEMRNRTEANEISSVLLFTDGQANVGFQSLEDIKKVMLDHGSLAQEAINGGDNNNRRFKRASPRRGFGTMLQGYFQPQQQQQVQQLREPQQQTTASLESTNTPLPCTVYTFGYGADHSPELLRGIAEHGDGVYYFIENSERIAESFADCLGGLLSVTSKDIRLHLNVPKDNQEEVAIKHLHNKKYKEIEHSAQKSYEVRIGDIQSEEKKDLLFTLSVPAISQPEDEYHILECELRYFNTITETESTNKCTITLSRPEVEPEGQQVNYLLDTQRNRITAVEAMEEATRLGDSSQLEEAKQVIDAAIAKIESSVSASDAFCLGLIDDLKRSKEDLVDRRRWASVGSKNAANFSSAHWVQRSSNTRADSQTSYQTRSKMAMRSRFK